MKNRRQVFAIATSGTITVLQHKAPADRSEPPTIVATQTATHTGAAMGQNHPSQPQQTQYAHPPGELLRNKCRRCARVAA